MTTTPSDGPALDVAVINKESASRYEAHIGDDLVGLTTYELAGDRVIFTHAEVYPRWEGQGVGSALARGALDDVIAQGKQITPLCPFIVSYIRRHPAYIEHVDDVHRSEVDATAAGEGK
jgi:predicted GNAT family acetyltransferase